MNTLPLALTLLLATPAGQPAPDEPQLTTAMEPLATLIAAQAIALESRERASLRNGGGAGAAVHYFRAEKNG